MWPRLCGMGLLNVHPAELQAVATRSHGWSVDVAVTAMPAAPEASIQATAAAVAAAVLPPPAAAASSPEGSEKVVLVSAYYNISSKHSWYKYSLWIPCTMRINAPFVLFYDQAGPQPPIAPAAPSWVGLLR